MADMPHQTGRMFRDAQRLGARLKPHLMPTSYQVSGLVAEGGMRMWLACASLPST